MVKDCHLIYSKVHVKQNIVHVIREAVYYSRLKVCLLFHCFRVNSSSPFHKIKQKKH